MPAKCGVNAPWALPILKTGEGLDTVIEFNFRARRFARSLPPPPDIRLITHFPQMHVTQMAVDQFVSPGF